MRITALAISLFVGFGLGSSSGLAQQTDYQCLSDCQSAGYLYRFCKERCSFGGEYGAGNSGGGILPNPAPPRQIDYTCQSDCLEQGYQLRYCQQLCSY